MKLFLPLFSTVFLMGYPLQAASILKSPSHPPKLQVHRFQIGPDLFWSHYRSGSYPDQEGTQFKATVNGVYGGLRLGYDYLQPDAFYAGTESLFVWGRDHIHQKTSPDPLASSSCCRSCRSCQQNSAYEHQTHLWAAIEQRLGYNVQSTVLSQSIVTPYVGIGWHYEKTSHEQSYWYYTAAGLKTLQRLYDDWQLGFDLKALFTFDIHDRGFISIITTQGKKTFWGFEAAIPIRWLIGTLGEWDFELKPYLLKLNLNSSQTILGIRAVFGYHF